MRNFKILFVTFVIVAFSLVYMLAAQEAKNTNKQSLMDQVNERYPDGVGRWRELFLDDDYLVASKEGISIVSTQATKLVTEPVLKKDQAWEKKPPSYTNVLYDEEEKTYKMWYNCLTEFHPYEPAGGIPGEEYSMLYAISEDGIHWEKPRLNVIYHKAQPTNIVFSGVTGMKAGVYFVLKDYSDPDPAKRYKVVFNFWDFRDRGLGVGWSPDGVHWQAPHPYTVIQGGFDTHNVAYWDDQYGCWVAYVRRWQYGKRQIARATSPDLFHWSYDTAIEGPDELDAPDEHLYTPACFQLKDARNVYVMVTGVFNGEKQIVTPQLAVSRDGIHWSRFRKPFIPFGKKDSWDSGGGWPLASEVPSGEDMLFYYIGVRKAHGDNPDSGIGVAAIKRDRYVGLQAGDNGGTITTHLLGLTHNGGARPERGALAVNANASSGSLRVEVLDESGNAISGYSLEDCIPVKGDKVEHYIRWKTHRNLYPVIGKPVRLRFHLQNATIYGFQVLRFDPGLSEEEIKAMPPDELHKWQQRKLLLNE